MTSLAADLSLSCLSCVISCSASMMTLYNEQISVLISQQIPLLTKEQSAMLVRTPLPQAYLIRTYSKKCLNEKAALFKVSNDVFKTTNRFYDMLFLNSNFSNLSLTYIRV
uniref:Secreted protein n=1 Tax=Heterorhabditis bacteriophora TaxID=37862 RepID=A0A1I7W871_HETBA